MYIPKIYKSEDEILMKSIINENGGNFYLETHISKANFQAIVLKDGDEVLCDFLGAHSYISSSWYEKINVSTWNYEAVQIYGKIELMNNDELYNHLDKLTAKYENSQKCPMLVEKMGKDYVENEMRGAFGIKIYPTEIDISQKLSQNRKEADYQNIILNLEQSPQENEKQIAEKMKKIREYNFF